MQVRTVYGHLMELDKNDQLELRIRGIWEPFETKIFIENLKSNYNILDIGSHIGYYSLIGALYSEKGKVVSIEPEPNNFKILQQNILINEYRDKIIPFNCALSDKNGKQKFYISYNNTAGHTLKVNKIGSENNIIEKTIEVNCITLDELFSRLKLKIDFIKIDAEGSELDIFRGGKQFLKDNKELKIITEFCPKFYAVSGQDIKDYYNLLRENGFDIWQLDDRVQKPLVINRYEDITYPNGFYTNLFCVRS
mgnify:CR=1 FL=1